MSSGSDGWKAVGEADDGESSYSGERGASYAMQIKEIYDATSNQMPLMYAVHDSAYMNTLIAEHNYNSTLSSAKNGVTLSYSNLSETAILERLRLLNCSGNNKTVLLNGQRHTIQSSDDTSINATPTFSEKFLTSGEIDTTKKSFIIKIIDTPDGNDVELTYDYYVYDDYQYSVSHPATRTWREYANLGDDWLTDDITGIISKYNSMIEANNKWETFSSLFNAGDGSDTSKLHYNQCLIDNEGGDGECWSKKYTDDKTTISFGTLWVNSGLYKLINLSDGLSTEEAAMIVQTIQDYCGPYYSEVMTNLTVLMIQASNNTISVETVNDSRVMPYDVDTLTANDRLNLTVSDPRVLIYKNSLVGGLASKLAITFNASEFIRPQVYLINICGRLTELSVLFEQWISFDWLDSIGLSPANLWNSSLVTFVMCALALLFILKTVKYVISLETANKIIILFLSLAIELGSLTVIAVNPTGVWNTVKRASNTIMFLGENTGQVNSNLDYLCDSDAAIYYLPYLNMWSIYNTGYSLYDSEQLIDLSKDTTSLEVYYKAPELYNILDGLPTINDEYIRHWSILLADSFEYHGTSISSYGTKITNSLGEAVNVNGTSINNNAYRVVDHFLAPRITYTKHGNAITMSVAQNENYNGYFQAGWINMIACTLNVCLMLLLSLIKFLTFLWFWYQLYVFIFKILIDRAFNNESWPSILIQTFSPVLCMVVIGLWASFCGYVCGISSGVICILLEICLWIATITGISIWSKNYQIFPRILHPLTFLLPTNKAAHSRWHNRQDAIHLRKNADLAVDVESDDSYCESLFDENGNYLADETEDGNSEQIVEWIDNCNSRIANGETLSAQEQLAYDKYKHMYDEHRGGDTNEE